MVAAHHLPLLCLALALHHQVAQRPGLGRHLPYEQGRRDCPQVMPRDALLPLHRDLLAVHLCFPGRGPHQDSRNIPWRLVWAPKNSPALALQGHHLSGTRRLLPSLRLQRLPHLPLAEYPFQPPPVEAQEVEGLVPVLVVSMRPLPMAAKALLLLTVAKALLFSTVAKVLATQTLHPLPSPHLPTSPPPSRAPRAAKALVAVVTAAAAPDEVSKRPSNSLLLHLPASPDPHQVQPSKS